MIEHLFLAYVDFIAKLLSRIDVRFGKTGIEISIRDEIQQSLDERIAKLDSARQNLLDGISAIDQLKVEAEHNKEEVSSALAQISALQQDKQQLMQELETVQAVISNDVDAFRRVAGFPTSKDIYRERIIGFISGVIASIVASAILFGLAEVYKYLEQHKMLPNPPLKQIEKSL